MSLSKHHADLVKRSGISAEVRDARGYRTVTGRAELEALGYAPDQCRVPGLLVPIYGLDGNVVTSQFRPDHPGPRKYETPRGSKHRLSVPPGALEGVLDPGVRLWVTEGDRKADAAVTAGLCCVSIAGVDAWSGEAARADLGEVPVEGRDVVVAFDSDAMRKPAVQASLDRLEAYLRGRGASVLRCNLPAGERGEKLGLDDVIAAGGDPRAFVSGSAWAVHSLSELTARGFKVEWVVRGWLVAGSYGMLAGPEKSLKTWIAVFESLAIATGKPLFGRFEVVKPGPVLFFTGEGTAGLLWSRLRHAARGMGIEDADFDALPIRVCDDVGPLTGAAFQQTLAHEIATREPVLTIIDPLYTYVAADADAGNLFSMGSFLVAASSVTSEAGVALKIGHHLRKSAGEHPTLADVTQSGSREWVSAWQLVSHREPPDLERGIFKLRLGVGSRVGFGGVWELDIVLGPFDEDTLQYSGTPTFLIRRGSDASAEQAEQREHARLEADADALARLGGSCQVEPFAGEVGVTRTPALRRLDALVDAGLATVLRGRGRMPSVYSLSNSFRNTERMAEAAS
jgi:hypothetical protein